MRLIFKQKFFSWFDSYDILYENGSLAYEVKGQLSWGHKLNIYDPYGNYIASVKEKIFTFLAAFDFNIGHRNIGTMNARLSFFRPKYDLDFNGWKIEGDFWGFNYYIKAPNGKHVVNVSKKLFNFTDTYIIDVANPEDALIALMIVLAIDAHKCSQESNQ